MIRRFPLMMKNVSCMFEGRMQNMCNLSELVEERAAKRERIEAIKRMLKADATKEQIWSYVKI